MAKAILIINVPDEHKKYTNLYLKGELLRVVYKDNGPLIGAHFFDTNIIELKPMPKRKEVRKVKYFNDVVHTQTIYDYIVNKMYAQVNYDVDRIFAEGYNACIDEILGGEENA